MTRSACLSLGLALACLGGAGAAARAGICGDYEATPRVTDVRAQEGAVTALAAAGDRLLVGLDNGDLKLYDLGSQPWRPYRLDTRALGAAPAAVALDGGLAAAVVAAPARLHLLTTAGDVLLPAAPPVVVAGVPVDVALHAGHAYVLGLDAEALPPRSWLTTVDLADAALPVTTDLRELPYPATALSAADGLLAVAGTADPNLQLLDLADPSSPQPAGQWHGGGLVRDVLLDGGDALLAGADGVWTVSVEVPSAPVLRLATAATPGWARAARTDGLDLLLRAEAQGGMEGLLLRDAADGLPRAALDPAGAAVAAVAGWAYLGRGAELVSVELRGAATPAELGGLDVEEPGDDLLALAVEGARGVAVARRDEGGAVSARLWLLDLADPAAPRRTAVLGLPGDPLATACAGDVAAVAVAAEGSLGGVHLLDVADAAAPRLLGTLTVPGDPVSVGFRGGVLDVLVRAVEAAVTDRWLRWLVTDPAVPQATAPVFLPGAPRCLLADPATGTAILGGDGLCDVYDLSDPLQPLLLTGYLTGFSFQSLARDAAGRVWTGLGGGLLARLDVSSPAHLVLADSVWLPGDPRQLHADGPRLWAACGDLVLLAPPPAGAPEPVGAVGAGVCRAVSVRDGAVLVAAGPAGLRVLPPPCAEVAVEPGGTRPELPAALRLGAPYPNPFNPSVRIPFGLERPGPVLVEVLDAAGRRVAVVARGAWPAGEHTVVWQGRDDAGRPAPSGVYLVRLRRGDEVQVRKTELLR